MEYIVVLDIQFPTKLRIILTQGDTGITLRNLVNMIYSKQFLIKKTFDITENIVEEEFALGINEA
ncbi:MAG: hypothetical protein PWQ37_2405 [Candidatus Petromonas sp.]|jgi:hypothetical protein|nr:hypothetical protein [Candidatus Petromonas sp.]